MAFKLKRSLAANQQPVLEKWALYNGGSSQVYDIGDMVMSQAGGQAGYATVATATNPLLGVIHGFVTPDGLPVRPSNDALTATADSVTVSTSGEYYALVDISQDSIYTVPCDSIGAGPYKGLSGELTDENSAAVPATAGNAQLYCWGIDPDNSANILVSIKESELKSVA